MEENQISPIMDTSGDDSKKRKRLGKIEYKKPFSARWLEVEAFKGWLEPFEDDKYKCLCKVCGKIFSGGKSEIRKHSLTKQHAAKVAESTGNMDEFLGTITQRKEKKISTKMEFVDMKSINGSTSSFTNDMDEDDDDDDEGGTPMKTTKQEMNANDEVLCNYYANYLNPPFPDTIQPPSGIDLFLESIKADIRSAKITFEQSIELKSSIFTVVYSKLEMFKKLQTSTNLS